MDDFRTEVDEHGNIKVTSYVEAVVISKEEQEQLLRIFKQLQEENDMLRELALQNWYIALSEREALRAHGIDPDGGTYMAALDDDIAIAKDRMRELGIEVEDV